jgi:RNA-directed DNA polymerase
MIAAAAHVKQGDLQGAVISPLVSSIHLDPLDHAMAAAGFEMVRYADDFVLLCRTEEEALRAWEAVGRWGVGRPRPA